MKCPHCEQTWGVDSVGLSRFWFWCSNCGTLIKSDGTFMAARWGKIREADAILKAMAKDEKASP